MWFSKFYHVYISVTTSIVTIQNNPITPPKKRLVLQSHSPYLLAPGNHWSVLCHHSFLLFKMSSKLNHWVCEFLRLVPSFSIIHLRFSQVPVVSIVFSYFIAKLGFFIWMYQFPYPLTCWKKFGLFSVSEGDEQNW